ncbi:O-methyltransferase [Streptomyces sp. NPDC006627]|uniref:O-methyltransferase n=1 Tax=Streptomyces sp. NPDC006627 TaxID=3154679 RepID=UPI0033B79D20
MNPSLYEYVLQQAPEPDPVQARLLERTRALGNDANMQVPHEQAVFLTFLTRLIGARTVVEVGTFTGYSTLALALGLTHPDGRVITCDINEDWTRIARQEWREAGVSDRIDLRLGPAADTLRQLPSEPGIDLAFIDADKPGYLTYWEEIVPRTRPGGVILVDNVLWAGEVLDPGAVGDARAIREFNDHVRNDDRVTSVLLPFSDGITFALRADTPCRAGARRPRP